VNTTGCEDKSNNRKKENNLDSKMEKSIVTEFSLFPTSVLNPFRISRHSQAMEDHFMNASPQQDFENILMMRCVESKSKLIVGQYTQTVYSSFIPSVRQMMSSVIKFHELYKQIVH
jgi:hypothetical protein